MMDYEKAYKAVLQTATQWIKDGCTDKERICLECVFPELRESEDERMMREFNDWLCEEIECRTNDLRDEKDRRTLNMLCYVLTKVKDWLEKQKEQKPNFSEKDSTDFEIEVHEIIAQARDDSRLNDANVLKQFEEEAAFALMLKANKLIEQKPAWSEEDEKDMAHIIRILDDCYAYGKHDLSKTDHENLVNKLKSLRPCPSWKPSEEQMRALGDYIDGEEISEYDMEEIVRLYHDLLKLK